MHQSIIQLTAPGLVHARRHTAERITVGDQASVRLEPGIFALLMNPMAGSPVPVGKDLHPMSTVPAGIAIDAATEACGVAQTGVGILRAMDFRLEAPATCKDPLVATATVVALGQRSARVSVSVLEENTGHTILVGTATLVRVVDGKAVPIPQ